VKRGELALELGAAPGGGTRALAEAGLRVVAVDPQPLDPAVVGLPGVTILARRAGDIKLAEVPADVQWLVSDMGIPPGDALRAIERLLPALPQLRGFLLTLTLTDSGVVRHLPQTFNELRRLGATEVRARQLAANRRDIFVYAPTRG
jgi:23S rRNA (cytidine2498-2'-O)-methyltransferase